MAYRGDCRLIPLPSRPGRGICPACDPDGSFPLLLGTHRTCGKRLDPREQADSLRERVEADIATDPRLAVPMNVVRRRLDVCFGGCQRFRGGVCDLHPKRPERYQRWSERVIDGDCL